jgi:hypothetical protein
MAREALADDLPGGDVESEERGRGVAGVVVAALRCLAASAAPMWSWFRPLVDPHGDGLSGRSEIEANRVAHRRTRLGSAESLIVFRRCGCRPKARQLRCTVETDRPRARDMPRELKWSASGSTLSRCAACVRHPVDPPVLDGAAHPSKAHCAERRGGARQSHGASVPDRLGAGRHWLVLRASAQARTTSVSAAPRLTRAALRR